MQYLRHARSGTVKTVTASECTDASAPRAIHAATCESLAASSSDLGLAAVLNGEIVDLSGAPPPPSSTPKTTTSDSTGLYVVIAVLAALLVITAVVAAVCVMKAKANKPVATGTQAKGGKSSVEMSSSSAGP